MHKTDHPTHLMATDKNDFTSIQPVAEDSVPRHPPVSGVRRRLDFGQHEEAEEVEHNLTANLDAADAPAQRERQRARDKWNFDFENEVPLDGDWEWEKVGGEMVPEVKEVVSSMEKIRKENRNL